ncbi:MAG: hypothetical protein ACXVCM_19545 [Ktedonobacteraceae bacterium]
MLLTLAPAAPELSLKPILCQIARNGAGAHQFHLPRSRIVAGTSNMRTNVASKLWYQRLACRARSQHLSGSGRDYLFQSDHPHLSSRKKSKSEGGCQRDISG